MALLPLLTPGAELPLDELAARLGSTPAEVAADVATLSMCGLPPYSPDTLVEAFVDDGIVRVFSGPPALDKPLRLTAAEAAALAGALEATGASSDDPLRAKLLSAASAPADAAEIASAVRAGVAPGGVAEVHAAIALATAEHEAVRIEYFSAARGEIGRRIVEPWALALERGAWYVSGYCRSAKAERVFRLDRIHTVEPTGETFEAPEDVVPPAVAAFGARDLYHANVRFTEDNDLSPRDWPGALFRRTDADDTLADVPYASPAWLARRVTARLGGAEAIGPEELRAEVVATARRTLAELGEL